MKSKASDVNSLTTEWQEAREKAMTRSKIKNNSEGTQNNIRRNSVYLAKEFQELKVNSPTEITHESFLAWVEGLKEGLFDKPLTPSTIKKRVETLRAILTACKLEEQLEFVKIWKPEKVAKEVKYWSIEEIEAMDETAMTMLQDESTKPRAICHLIHSMMAPRIADCAGFKWEYFDFQLKIMQFRAKKNKKRCSQYIQERYIPILKEYRQWVSKFDGGDVYLFPKAMLSKSGTTKKNVPHATDKTIRLWLYEVRDSTKLNGEDIQKLSSHSYRHSLAMRYLGVGNTFENIAMVLGDEIGTLERHYAELIPTEAQRLAHQRAFKLSNWISSEGTAQPEWLRRPRGSDANFAMWSSIPNKGYGLESNGGRWGI